MPSASNNGSFCLFPSPFSTSTLSASPKYHLPDPCCEQTWTHTPPFPSSDCYPSHWILTPIWWCFPAVRSWGGSLLWLLHEENWTSWNALVRLLCYYSNGVGWLRGVGVTVRWNIPKITPRQNTCLFVNKDDAHWAFPQCQVLPVILSIFTPHIR